MLKPIKLPPLPPAKLEIINLIDVLITLIAFFMLTAVFAKKNHRLSVNLPSAPRLLLDNELFHRLKECNHDTIIVIKADRDCRYGRIVQLLDIVKSRHLTKIALEVRK